MFDELGIRRCRSALGEYDDVDHLILNEVLPVLNRRALDFLDVLVHGACAPSRVAAEEFEPVGVEGVRVTTDRPKETLEGSRRFEVRVITCRRGAAMRSRRRCTARLWKS